MMSEGLQIPVGWRLDAVEGDTPMLAPTFARSDVEGWKVGRIYQLTYHFRNGTERRVRARFEGVRGNALAFTRLYGKLNEPGEHLFLYEHSISKSTWKRNATTRRTVTS